MTNPIEAAVLPLKQEAIARAEAAATKLVQNAVEELERFGWCMDAAAPKYKGSITDKYRFLSSITTYTQATRRLDEPEYRKRDAAAEQRFINAAKDNAAQQYDEFVAKLVSKVGECETAVLRGNHVWGYSTLVIDGEEYWNTQMIVNTSKLGKVFNQFPTRKSKKARVAA